MRRATAVSMLAAAPWIGLFHLQVLGGTVDDSWTLHHADAGACDVSASGHGSESGTLGAGAPVVVSLVGAGPTAFLVPVAGLQVNAVLDREGSITAGPDDGDDTDGCPSGDGSAPPPPDCGLQTLPLTFAFTPGTLPALSASSIDSPWKNCPVEGATLPAVPDTTAGPSVVSGIGPIPDPPDVTFHVTGTDQQSDGDVDATSKLDVELRLERLSAVETIVLPGAYKTAAVDGSGATKVPVGCPAGAACKGTVGIATSGFGAEQRDVAPPAWPRPLAHAEPLLGSARFSLKGGRKGRIVVRLAHGSMQAIKALAGQPLDVIVRQAARGRAKPIAYVAGQVELRPR